MIIIIDTVRRFLKSTSLPPCLHYVVERKPGRDGTLKYCGVEGGTGDKEKERAERSSVREHGRCGWDRRCG